LQFSDDLVEVFLNLSELCFFILQDTETVLGPEGNSDALS